MKITFVTLGKFKSVECRSLFDEYLKRLGRYFPTSTVALAFNEKKAGSQDEALLKFLSTRSGSKILVILDERGKSFKSGDFSRQLEKWKDSSTGEVIIAVGGAHGYTEETHKHAGMLWSLSPLTFAHELAAVVAAEQLYRGATILAGHPYHNE